MFPEEDGGKMMPHEKGNEAHSTGNIVFSYSTETVSGLSQGFTTASQVWI